MRFAKIVGFGLLIIYSVSLVYLEIRFSQDYVRNYFTDIIGPVFFYAVNTTLSTTLLWLTTLVFVINAMCVENVGRWKRQKLFYYSQALVFFYLGIDERFMVHEYTGMWLGFNDALMLLGIAIAEAGLLAGLGELKTRSKKTIAYLCAGSVLFGVMSLIDGFAPKRATLRLSFEDLSKVWAEVFLFLFAFEICRGLIDGLKERARSAETTRD